MLELPWSLSSEMAMLAIFQCNADIFCLCSADFQLSIELSRLNAEVIYFLWLFY